MRRRQKWLKLGRSTLENSIEVCFTAKALNKIHGKWLKGA
jgi:hypothetical protein